MAHAPYAKKESGIGKGEIEMSRKDIKKAMEHPNILGAGARKREKLSSQDKFHTVLKEFERGTLHSGSGQIVKKKDQALAIAFSEARKHKK